MPRERFTPDGCVFEGVARDNPWLDTLYENVNSILLHSNMLGAPTRWSFALAVGHFQASHPKSGRRLRALPCDPARCPGAIRALVPEMRVALEHLSKSHIGVMLQMDAREREERRIQRTKARLLLKMMCGDGRSGYAA